MLSAVSAAAMMSVCGTGLSQVPNTGACSWLQAHGSVPPGCCQSCQCPAWLCNVKHIRTQQGSLVQIRTCHPLAICYNDQSPLENHHLAAAVRTGFVPEHHYVPVTPRQPPTSMTCLLVIASLCLMLRWLVCSILCFCTACVLRALGSQREKGRKSTVCILESWYLQG